MWRAQIHRTVIALLVTVMVRIAHDPAFRKNKQIKEETHAHMSKTRTPAHTQSNTRAFV